jgi:hypothetical protein
VRAGEPGGEMHDAPGAILLGWRILVGVMTANTAVKIINSKCLAVPALWHLNRLTFI